MIKKLIIGTLAILAFLTFGLWPALSDSKPDYKRIYSISSASTLQDCRLMAETYAFLFKGALLPNTRCVRRKDGIFQPTAYGKMNADVIPHITGGHVISPYVELPQYSPKGNRADVNYGEPGGDGESGYGMVCHFIKVYGRWYRLRCERTWIA